MQVSRRHIVHPVRSDRFTVYFSYSTAEHHNTFRYHVRKAQYFSVSSDSRAILGLSWDLNLQS